MHKLRYKKKDLRPESKVNQTCLSEEEKEKEKVKINKYLLA